MAKRSFPLSALTAASCVAVGCTGILSGFDDSELEGVDVPRGPQGRGDEPSFGMGGARASSASGAAMGGGGARDPESQGGVTDGGSDGIGGATVSFAGQLLNQGGNSTGGASEGGVGAGGQIHFGGNHGDGGAGGDDSVGGDDGVGGDDSVGGNHGLGGSSAMGGNGGLGGNEGPGGSASRPLPVGDPTQGHKLVVANNCTRCHGADLAGRSFFRNITPDMETGVGAWTDEEIALAIRGGFNPAGEMLCASMPLYSGLNDQGVADMVAYLRSVPAISNKILPVCPGHDP